MSDWRIENKENTAKRKQGRRWGEFATRVSLESENFSSLRMLCICDVWSLCQKSLSLDCVNVLMYFCEIANILKIYKHLCNVGSKYHNFFLMWHLPPCRFIFMYIWFLWIVFGKLLFHVRSIKKFIHWNLFYYSLHTLNLISSLRFFSAFCSLVFRDIKSATKPENLIGRFVLLQISSQHLRTLKSMLWWCKWYGRYFLTQL